MPGLVPHLISGSIIFLIGSYYFKSYFDVIYKNNKIKETLILAMVCILFSILPDFILKDITFDNKLNMTRLALFFSHYVNGVAKKHGEVSRLMFPGYTIDSSDL